MRKDKLGINILSLALGIILLIGGTSIESEKYNWILALALGVGVALIALAAVRIIGTFLLRKNIDELEEEKRLNIEDERNKSIKEKVAVKLNDIMFFVWVIFIVMLNALNADKIIILMAGFVIIIHLVVSITLYSYYNKRM